MRFSKESFDKLNNRIGELLKDKAFAKIEHGLIYLLLSQKFLREPDEIKESIVDGANDCGVDAIFINRSKEQPVIHIIQSKFSASERKAKNAFKASALDKISRFFEILKNTDTNLSKVCNSALEQKVLEIRELQTKDFPIFKVWLISNGSPCVQHEIQPLITKLQSKEITVEEFHLSDFVEFCINSHSSRSQHVFRVKEAGVLESGNTELYSVVGYISARELYGILKDLSNERKMDYSLFDMNVRSFLGTDSSINKEIYKSASSPHNAQFSSLNNGITIIGTDVKVMKTSEPCKIGVKKMSIVNGAQTCSAIFDCMKNEYPDFSKFENLSVLFRLFQTNEPDIIERVAISTNSQNRIQPRDLRANDNYQIKLEQELAEKNITYIRKRGRFGDEKEGGNKLDALKAGQLILSYAHYEPANAKRQSDNIFSDWYNKIFASVDVSKLVRAYELYSKIEDYQKFINDEIRIRGISRTDNTFVTYGGFHVLTLCSKLEQVFPQKNDDELIKEALNIIAECLLDAGQPAYYSFFRDKNITEKMIQKCTQPNLFDVQKTGT